jgi:gluconolactonase
MTMSQTALLDVARDAAVFCGGIRSPYRLDHPEGICVDPRDGALWCGGEGGQLYRIQPDGSAAEQIACTGGFLLGIAFDSVRQQLYLCDLHYCCVWIYSTDGKLLGRLDGRDGDETLRLPNYAVLSTDGRYLYVSDTHREGGPGIWRFELATGFSTLWMRERCLSANGLALAPDGSALYLVESHLPGVSRVPIRIDGSAGPKEIFLLLSNEPDGLAFSPSGDLWISIYNPTRIYRCRLSDRRLQIVIADDSTDVLHHSTNLAFRGRDEVFSANLGAWHITRINLSKLPA